MFVSSNLCLYLQISASILTVKYSRLHDCPTLSALRASHHPRAPFARQRRQLPGRVTVLVACRRRAPTQKPPRNHPSQVRSRPSRAATFVAACSPSPPFPIEPTETLMTELEIVGKKEADRNHKRDGDDWEEVQLSPMRGARRLAGLMKDGMLPMVGRLFHSELPYALAKNAFVHKKWRRLVKLLESTGL